MKERKKWKRNERVKYNRNQKRKISIKQFKDKKLKGR